jgi:hypothetical protein
LPVNHWLTLDAQIEDRYTDVPSTKSASNEIEVFTPATLPGLASQPNFLHSSVGLQTLSRTRFERASDVSARNTTGPLLKHKLILSLRNEIHEHWYTDTDTGHYSFQQFVFNGQESLELGAIVQRWVRPGTVTSFWGHLFYGTVGHFCDGLRVNEACDFGTLSLRTHLAASAVGSGNEMPFYLQPTVGGADIDSQLSLRGYGDYRFRDRDAAFLQFEYAIPVWRALGALVFYDAGNVGRTLSALSIPGFRQDGGTGANFRLQGNVVAQTYVAWGAGHGAHLGYSLAKLF